MPHASESGLSGWRRHAAVAFIVLWLGVQIGVPFVQKFELSSLQYRWARYSWAMFSRPGPRYEIRLFRTRAEGPSEPIPEIRRYVRGYRSPEPMSRHAPYWTEDELLNRLARLVTHIARVRQDGYTYVAEVRWLAYQRADLPLWTELRADSAR